MMDYNDIRNRIAENSAKIKELDAGISALPWSRHEERDAMDRNRSALTLENNVLHDNARRAYVSKVWPVIVETFWKYDGKPLGPKTLEKINAEIKARRSCRVYLDGNELHIIPLTPDGWAEYFWRNNDLVLYPAIKDGKRLDLLDGNRISGAAFDTLEIQYCQEYEEDPAARAAAIIEAKRKVRAAFEECEKLIEKYNALAPSGVNHAYITGQNIYY